MKYLNFLLPLAVSTTLFTACEKNGDDNGNIDYSKGVYIVNEGSFNSNNGSISYYNPDENVIVNNVFETANGYPAGDVLQSFAVVTDSLGYIIANNSHKVEIVRLKNFEIARPALQVIYPRYFLQVSDTKGYISAFRKEATGCLYVVDLENHNITDSIMVGSGPETMVKIDNFLYVANSGGFYADSTLSIVNTNTDEIVDTIKVCQLPSDIVLDVNENIWVYGRGYTNWVDVETASLLQKINPVSQTIVWSAQVGAALDYTTTSPKMAVSSDGSTIYYVRPDGIYSINAQNPQISASPLIAGTFYGLEVNPHDGNIYAFETTSFTSNGVLKIYSASGVLLTEGVVGVGPNGAAFNL
jgi:hypothetical protein